nr:hypothetical protein [Propionibacteriaceae bacterium]
SRLVLPLPRVYVSGRSAVSGQIALDQLRLKASVVTDGSTARLEGFVSGLFGSPNISTQFGDTPMKPSGLGLQISGLGAISVAKAKPAAAKEPAASKQPATAKKPAAKKPAAKAPGKPATKKAASKPGTKKAAASKPAPPQNRTPQPMNPLQKVRRAVPKPLEPLAKRIAKSPVMRSLYRRVAKL